MTEIKKKHNLNNKEFNYNKKLYVKKQLKKLLVEILMI